MLSCVKKLAQIRIVASHPAFSEPGDQRVNGQSAAGAEVKVSAVQSR
jgi:hypothetical protein